MTCHAIEYAAFSRWLASFLLLAVAAKLGYKCFSANPVALAMKTAETVGYKVSDDEDEKKLRYHAMLQTLTVSLR